MGKLTALRNDADRGLVIQQYVDDQGEHRLILDEVDAVVTIEVCHGEDTSSLELNAYEVDFLRGFLNDEF
ncbi:MAG: hypothetical protein JWO67_3841 [Streptosporangiaceae bacterium]|nr:hypothetical protein [Streptosporangiaceae bacterium]